MSARMYDDQDKLSENGKEERLDENDRSRATSALLSLHEYLNDPTNHLKKYEEEVKRLIANVSREFEQITTTAKVELERKNIDLRRRLIESETDRKRYRTERNELREKLYIHEEKKFTTEQELELRREIKELKKARDQTEEEWAKRLKELEETSDAIIKEQKQKHEQTLKDVNVREMKIKSLQGMLETTRLGFSDWNEMKKQLADNERQLNETNDRLQRALSKLNFTEKELDETKSRLSKAVGDKLTDNNPNIADLSDKNRPTKLAEKYAELYDNQWTDAFEEIEKYLRTEEEVIRVLLEILMDVKSFCENKAKRQMESLKTDLTCSNNQTNASVPDNVTKQLKDVRKIVATAAKENLYQMYISSLKRTTDENLRHAMKIEPFVKECFEVCWFMAIQDPPIVLCASGKRGDSLDTNLYKAYTNSGRYIEFVVWPAMLLHESGPVLGKGVAQGTNEKKAPHAWVEEKARREVFTTTNRDIYDFRSLGRTQHDESDPYGQSLAKPLTRDNPYLTYDLDRNQRPESAEATRPSYKQSTVATMALDLKQNSHIQQQKYEKHPTRDEMKIYVYYRDRQDVSGAIVALGYDTYMKCKLRSNKRS